MPSRSNVPTARLSDSRRFCSSGSKSRWAVPSSTRPSRGMAPALNMSCSASVVLPAPTCPVSTTLRRWGRSTLFIVIGASVLVLRERPGCLMGEAGPAIIVGYTPPRDVRSFQVVHDQARQGHHRCQAWRPVHQGRARDLRGGPPGRRRSRRELPPAPRHREGPLRQHAGGQHQADHRQGDRQRRCRAVRGDRLRGLRPGRDRRPRRDPDRQQEPDRGRRPLDVHQVRRPARRLRRRRLAVRTARPDLRPAGRHRCR